jgi:putative acyl-CoA dehydrogenase
VAKFWICKRGSHFAQEAMECLGGNGYVEEGGRGRHGAHLPRDAAQLHLGRRGQHHGHRPAARLRKADAAAALAHELAPARGAHPALDRLAAALPTRVEAMATEMEARRLAQDVALAVQAALLYQSAPAEVFSAFCDSRLGGNWGHAFGTLGAQTDFDPHHRAHAALNNTPEITMAKAPPS